MPKQKVRKKTDYTINPASRTPVKVRGGRSSGWYGGVMLALMLFGLVWLVVYYLIASEPVGVAAEGGWMHWMYALQAWNFAIGFAFMIAGLLMTMGWK